jgi:hypothetical protein
MSRYVTIGWLFAVPTFIGSWIYCIAAYGFLLGVGLGWLPSAICAVVMVWLWPVAALALVGVVGVLLSYA